MNTLETLYFPDTAIISDRQFPLFLLFSTVHYLQPVEREKESEERSLDTFMDNQFCQAHTPHPLGKDRERFLYLINDLKNRKDDYAAQLSNITIASMSGNKKGGDNSKHEIMSSLLGRDNAIAVEYGDQEPEELWQARLILKIAEILDREEEEVAKALVSLEESESELFARLKGKDGDDEGENLYQELQKINSKLSKPPIESIQNRLRSWFRLIRNTELPPCSVWTTSRQEVADFLFENYEGVRSSSAPLIAQLELPARTGNADEQAIEKMNALRSEAKVHLNTFYQKISTATGDISDDYDFTSFLSSWQQILDKHFPLKKFGRSTIQFYLLKDHLTDFTGNEADRAKNRPSILAVFAS